MVDLASPIRKVITDTPAITSLLSTYKGSFPVFTRRPIPLDATPPTIVISPDVTQSNTDGVFDQRPTFIRDISVYGLNDSSTSYRNIETIAYLIHDLFHRKRNIVVSGWNVVLVSATGPIVAPVDDDNNVGRIVTLSIQLAKLGIA